MRISDARLAEVYNDETGYPTLADVAEALGVSFNAIKSRVEILRRNRLRGADVPELISRVRVMKAGTRRQTLILEAEDAARALPDSKMTASRFKAVRPHVTQEEIETEFGGTAELFRAAAIEPTRGARRVVLDAARHASQDHVVEIGGQRLGYSEKYLKPAQGRFKTILGANDLHDELCDPFWLRVFVDTARRVQPDVICLNGDVFDLAEFGKYAVDPRTWNIVAKIRFVHEQILAPLREACPNAQIDLIEGNHEHRLYRHLAEAAPAMRSLLSDLHGMDIQQLLGLDRFEVNYVAKGSLKAFTKGDVAKEVAKNYRIYFDTVLVNHFPDAKRMGMPGWNGHHHSHAVDQLYSPTYGAYEWHQFGCGHQRDADYCAGEKWGMGFGLIHVDTSVKATNFEYVPVTDFAVVGGKWYVRTSSETRLK